MEQHPIPQQISAYEFRLVGSMTLKQFLKLAGGVLSAYLVYNSGLILILRFPLALILLLLGIGMAFLPINERPLEFWILAFLRAIYSPTIYTREKSNFLSPSSTTTLIEDDYENKEKTNPEPKTKEKSTTFSQGKGAKEKKKPEARAVILEKAKEGKTKAESEKKDIASPLPQLAREKRPSIRSTDPDYLESPLPAAPTAANIVNGLVLDDKGRILEGAIVEIQDEQGNPIRAMRTNSLGQFQTATPLPEGNYLLLAEKPPFQFETIKLKADGEIIPPLQIQAKPGGLN